MPDEIDCVLTVDNLLRRWKISRSTLERRLRAGDIPAPFKIGSGLRWRLSEIQQFETRPDLDATIDNLAAVRDKLDVITDDPPAAAEAVEKADTKPNWAKLRRALEGLEKADDEAIAKLAELAHDLGVDADRLELFAVAVTERAAMRPIADEFASRDVTNDKAHQHPRGNGLAYYSDVSQLQAATQASLEASRNARAGMAILELLFWRLFGKVEPERLTPRGPNWLAPNTHNAAIRLGIDWREIVGLPAVDVDEEDYELVELGGNRWGT